MAEALSQNRDAKGARSPSQLREFVTPEGVDLKLTLADASERASAFLLDVVFVILMMTVMTIVLVVLGLATGFAAAPYLASLWLLGFFFLRLFYFAAFEMTARAATPGKRILGLRVTTRDGSALSGDAIFVRNAVRELEVFLPLSFFAAQVEVVDAWISIAAIVWCGVFAPFPLFNRDRLRIGDLLAGTWVVRVPRRLLSTDMSRTETGSGPVFARPALEAYGIRELSVLEDVLRRKDLETMGAVAARIRAKIGMTDDRTPDEEFLSSYYTALRGRLEARLLFGRRKRDKFDVG
jgi:uncharacterized RDD family membrane protein YckC